MSVELTIVTPEGEALSGTVESVVLPGSEGDFGVLEGHERFLAPLRIGEVEIRDSSGSQFAALSDGFAEVADSQVVVMVETCELAADIDQARAERAKTRAEGRLEAIRSGQEEDRHLATAEAALQRAIIRIQVAAKAH